MFIDCASTYFYTVISHTLFNRMWIEWGITYPITHTDYKFANRIRSDIRITVASVSVFAKMIHVCVIFL